jgi:hypothetical protein
MTNRRDVGATEVVRGHDAATVGWIRRAEASTVRCTVYDPADAPPQAHVAIARMASPDPDLDTAILSILDVPVGTGETIALAYQRKEAALLNVFAALDVNTSRVMHARLSLPRAGDTVAERFGRLTMDRRGRLLAFLADVRRRHALATRGRR